MKKSWNSLSRKLLTAAIAFGWYISTNQVSVFLFGEYPYPEKND